MCIFPLSLYTHVYKHMYIYIYIYVCIYIKCKHIYILLCLLYLLNKHLPFPCFFVLLFVSQTLTVSFALFVK